MSHRALLIGSAAHGRDPGLPNLCARLTDLSSLEQALTDTNTGLHARENVRTLVDAPRADVLIELHRFLTECKAEDQLLVYWLACVHTRDGDAYYCAADSERSHCEATAISADDLRRALRALRAERLILLLELYSAATTDAPQPNELASELILDERFVAISSTAPWVTANAAESDGLRLAHALAGALRNGADQAAPDGLLHVRDAYNQLHRQLPSRSRNGLLALAGVGAGAVLARRSGHQLAPPRYRCHWSQDGFIAPHLHATYRDDVQVIVHKGRYSTEQPEAMWVRLLEPVESPLRDLHAYEGELLNQPQRLSGVSKGQVLLVLSYQGMRQPISTTRAYLDERERFRIEPCSRCGNRELFDPPSVLLAKSFPGQSILSFTSRCLLCGGAHLVDVVNPS